MSDSENKNKEENVENSNLETRVKVKKSKFIETIETIIIALILAIFIRATVAEARFIPSESMVPTLLVQDRLVVEKISNYTGNPKRGEILVFYPPFEKGPNDDTFVGNTMKWLGFTKNVAYIKRVIGLPGETIEVKGHYEINDETITALKESMVDSKSIDEAKKLIGKEFVGKDEIYKALMALNINPTDKELILSYSDVKGRVYINGEKLEGEDYIKEYPRYDMPPVKIPEGHLFMLGDNRNNSMDSHVWGTLPIKNVIGHAVLRFWPPQRIGTIK